MILNLDEKNFKRAGHFLSLYEIDKIISDADEITFLGSGKFRKCRYCLNGEPEVSFHMDAHVIPQFMGNRNLLSYFECDTCNSLFSKYEDSFARFLGLSRTFAQIKGQTKKVPKFKDMRTGMEVFQGEDKMQVTFPEGQMPFHLDEKAKTIEFDTVISSYVPIHIPKILIKMALATLSDADMENYEQTRLFLQKSENDHLFANNGALRILGYHVPGPPKYPSPYAHLYRLKDGVEPSCFKRQFVLFYANYCFQIGLPFGKEDEHLNGKKVEFPVYPLTIDQSYFDTFGDYQELNLDLTSHKIKRGEKRSLTLSYQSGGKVKADEQEASNDSEQ